ncbi:MAG: hypothetical protein MHMPM18_003489, partial [Marteilia pararefringens]
LLTINDLNKKKQNRKFMPKQQSLEKPALQTPSVTKPSVEAATKKTSGDHFKKKIDRKSKSNQSLKKNDKFIQTSSVFDQGINSGIGNESGVARHTNSSSDYLKQIRTASEGILTADVPPNTLKTMKFQDEQVAQDDDQEITISSNLPLALPDDFEKFKDSQIGTKSEYKGQANISLLHLPIECVAKLNEIYQSDKSFDESSNAFAASQSSSSSIKVGTIQRFRSGKICCIIGGHSYNLNQFHTQFISKIGLLGDNTDDESNFIELGDTHLNYNVSVNIEDLIDKM